MTEAQLIHEGWDKWCAVVERTKLDKGVWLIRRDIEAMIAHKPCPKCTTHDGYGVIHWP